MFTPIETVSLRTSRTGIHFARKRYESKILAALFHLGAELSIDHLGKATRPLVHIGDAELNGLWLRHEQLLTERRFVKSDEVLQLLLGELVGVELGHAFPDFLLTAGKILGDDHRDLVEILLVVEKFLRKGSLGLLH